ncbi:F0F1 ATP synthase subunit delta [Paenibacillus brevis]|uniref:ATP synthase subunit delta n=1 Tax=Paenibacillus brevis TaxID=2841508 RepID=A0ABS6FL71_9BACL|nr:F0F1 ATP synthase subunit delta [Paenibacillus brevis]MBU5670911.1 F0F1 ATP synthase subunit delta [Paenibacillus brevis]
MSRETVVAGRYAKALYEIADQDQRTLEMEQELQALVHILHEDLEIEQFILSPKISSKVKWDVIRSGLEGRLSQTVISLAKLLIDRGRIEILPELLFSYTKIAGEKLGQVNALVTSVYPLSEQEQATVASEFGQLVNKKVRIQNIVDKSLLGGIKVRIGDTLYDGSLSGKLERLEKSFRRQAL